MILSANLFQIPLDSFSKIQVDMLPRIKKKSSAKTELLDIFFTVCYGVGVAPRTVISTQKD